MIKINKMLGVGVLILAILMAGAVLTTATSTESNDAPEAKVGPGAEVEIMNFTIEDGGDSIINDTDAGLSAGDNLTDDFANVTLGNDSDWTNVSSYDAEDGDDWNASVDFLYINNSGTAVFNNSSETDYVIGGNYSVMGKAIDEPTKMTYGGFDSDWDFTSLDADDADGDFNVTNDAIIIDGDNNGFYQDNFTGISIVSDSEDNPINYSVIDSINISNSTAEVANNTIDDTPFSISLTDENITADTTYTVNMTLNETLEEWDEDYYNMLANATLTLASGEYNVVNGNTIKASHVYLDSEYYDEDVTITITLEDDALNDDPNRIQEKNVTLTSDSDVEDLKITLVETGADTGVFTADVITSSGTVFGNELHAENGDTITVTNDDNSFNDTAKVDSSAPTDIEVTSPDTLTYNKSTDTLDVDYKYSETNPNQTTIQFVNSDGDVDAEFVQNESDSSDVDTSVELTLSEPDTGEFAEGLYSIKLSVEDAAGNVNNTEILQEDVLMIDETGPSVVGEIANNITETENYYNGYYNNSFAFNLTFDLEDVYGEIDDSTVTLHYNNSTSEGTITPVNVTTVGTTATYNATIDTEDDGMADNTTIEFWLEANDTVGNTIDNGGNASNPLVSYTVDKAAPEAPANFDAVAETGVINLSWDAATDDASGVDLYKIYRNETGTDFIDSDYIGNTTETSYSDFNSTLAADVNYNYTVVAVDNLDHESDEADSANATFVPGVPADITFTTGSSSIIADGRDTAEITATIVDGNGNAVGEGNLSFSKDAGDLQVEDLNESYQVNDEGSYTVYLTSTETGMANVTASLESKDITNTTQVYFTNDSAKIDFDRAGTNMISLPLIPADSSIEEVLEGIDETTNVEIVWAYDAQTYNWTRYIPGVGGELEEMEDGKGYYVITDSIGSMTVRGFEDKAPGKTRPAYEVYKGWNLIGFKYTGDMNSSEYLGNVATSTDRLYGLGGELEMESNMQQGQGYWLAVSQDGTIHPPGYTQEDA